MNTRKRKIKVIVSGTNFGRIYLDGVTRNQRCKLVGILAQGSRQSRICASKYKVPLYTKVEELNKSMVDVVCIAIKSTVTGGAGTEIALECLKKGIHVIQEQPVHYNDVRKCYKMALLSNCHYIVNNFYSNIKAGKLFVDYAKKLLTQTQPLVINASCSIQVLYPMIDLMGSVFGCISPYNIRKISQNDKILTVLEGKICNVPFILNVENRMSMEDSDNYALLFHKIVLFTESGQLIMDNSLGIVLWEPRYYIPHTKDKKLDLYGENKYSLLPVTEILNIEDLSNTYIDIYNSIWPEGIKNMLEDFVTLIDKPLDKKYMQYQLDICGFWNEVGNALGPAQIVPDTHVFPMTAQNIVEVKS